ncbi:MAG: hypothetical protein ABFC63_04690 [Thermoguttaceae bacterium]
MNSELIVSLMEDIGSVEPPGCVNEYIEHPNPLYQHKECVEVGFMMEHRFAFHYWIKCKQTLQKDRHTKELIDDERFMPPDLVTWDWHDDCGADSDIMEERLAVLNQADEQEVGLYSWAGLCQLNDGQILPAVWLNALGNVYIVQKQKQDCLYENRTLKDRYGHEHQIFYFRSLKHFPKTFERTHTGAGVIWDIDLDFFTNGRKVSGQSYTAALSATKIEAMLSPNTSWMPLILRNLKAITIALEPDFTGGLSVSLELYRHWESALFAKPLFSKKCRWRKGVLKV